MYEFMPFMSFLDKMAGIEEEMAENRAIYYCRKKFLYYFCINELHSLLLNEILCSLWEKHIFLDFSFFSLSVGGVCWMLRLQHTVCVSFPAKTDCLIAPFFLFVRIVMD